MKTHKIDFSLETSSGYPPIAVERLNARECSPGEYEILNSPFFVKEIAYGDKVTADLTDKGRLSFNTCITQSTYKAISIIILDDEIDHKLMDIFKGKECIIEYGEFGNLKMAAIAIPDNVDYIFIKRQLDDLEKSESLSYEELVA